MSEKVPLTYKIPAEDAPNDGRWHASRIWKKGRGLPGERSENPQDAYWLRCADDAGTFQGASIPADVVEKRGYQESDFETGRKVYLHISDILKPIDDVVLGARSGVLRALMTHIQAINHWVAATSGKFIDTALEPLARANDSCMEREVARIERMDARNKP